ncbi:SA1320 family protein [Alkalicoccobacillus porphyridii]|uniref:DUF2974 domain-containing protein n=1 Tax=Alkalicoccobacillus porphyridii TaxID=2597270 RepID=A0A554A483_9BACI|nr:hypothetical protein [Alkalicoccobacillus porphyridii]TSB48486.1 hypothetical protein FN960_02730 [Alkalicoccobacillus porphyridii]
MMNPPVEESLDTNLVELAGYHAYRNYQINSIINANDNMFRVVNTIYDHPTGLDALTVESLETGEFTVVYVGTATETSTGEFSSADIVTDMMLVSDLDVPQLEAAEAYYREMDQKYGVDSVAGNSLGGALANNVAVQHEDVRSVTLNPALLPFNGVMDPNKVYDNITNYFSEYDALTKGLSSIGMSEQIPGQVYNINNGIPLLNAIGSNHTGYVNRADGGQFYEIGTKGEPGYGQIHIAAHEHIVTSIWTGLPLHGGSTDRILINQESLETLASSLNGYVKERLVLSHEYMENALAIIQHERDTRAERERKLKEQFFERMETFQQMHLTMTSGAHTILSTTVQNALDIAGRMGGPIGTLISILNSPPAKLVDHLFLPNIDLFERYTEISDRIFEALEQAGEFQLELQNLTDNALTELFSPVTGNFSDAVVDELYEHYVIVNQNYAHVTAHLGAHALNVSTVGCQFTDNDEAVASTISGQGVGSSNHTFARTDFSLNDSEYLENALNLKQLHVDVKFQALKTLGVARLTKPLSLILVKIFAVEGAIFLLKESVRNIASRIRTAASTLPFSDIDQLNLYEVLVKTPVESIINVLDDLESFVRGLRTVMSGLISGLPTVFDEFKPYIDTAIFNDSSYLNVQLYTTSAAALNANMKLLFNDVNYQLTDQQGNAIVKLHSESVKFTDNMNVLDEQVQRGTVI